jgi:hypothetical protein
MVAEDLTKGVSGLAGGLIDVAFILMIVLLSVAILIGIYFLIKNFTRYKQFKVVIWEVLDSGGIRVSYDNAGIFVMKKTGNKLLYLKRSNVGLNPDLINYIIDSKGKKVIYLLRYGFKNFVFINPVADNLGKLDFKVGEEDVNWAVNSYEANKKRFSQSLLVQLLPFMVLALVCIIILILMVSLFKQFSVFAQVAEAIREAAASLSAVKSGAVI